METGKKVSIEVTELLFDPQNPRLPRQLQGVKNEKKIIEYMVGYESVTDLMESIAETGYSDAEPLLIVKNSSEKFVVVEGNRRLAAVKLLNNPQLSELRKNIIKEIVENARISAPQKIPCILYEKRESILDYLGYRHITGVKDWGALEKARYLDQLYTVHIANTDTENIYKKLAKMIGSKASYLKNLHMALKLYEYANDEAYFQTGIKEKDVNFSWITTVLGLAGITEYIGYDKNNVGIENINKKNFEKVFIWMYDKEKGVISESRELTKLSSILSCKKATEKLEKGATLSEAILFTSEPEEAFLKLLRNAKSQLEQAKASIEQLNGKPELSDDLLNDIEKLSRTIKGALYANFNDELNNTKILGMPNITEEQVEKLLKLLGK